MLVKTYKGITCEGSETCASVGFQVFEDGDRWNKPFYYVKAFDPSKESDPPIAIDTTWDNLPTLSDILAELLPM